MAQYEKEQLTDGRWGIAYGRPSYLCISDLEEEIDLLLSGLTALDDLATMTGERDALHNVLDAFFYQCEDDNGSWYLAALATGKTTRLGVRAQRRLDALTGQQEGGQ